jgi:hypothetical protein
MVQFLKVWNEKDSGKYGSKVYYFDERTPVVGIEGCKVKDEKGQVIECTKVIYPSMYVTLMGTPIEFMQKCKDANIAALLLSDLYAQGITIKQFLEQNERINGVNFS